MTGLELVSVITVCYNSAATIERTIKSVLNQSWRNIEYIIIDGQSEDETLSIVRRYEPLFGGRMVVVSEKDHGIYDAMNKGVKMAKGEWVGIINSDDYYELNAIETVMRYKKETPYQVCYGAVRHWKDGLEYSTVLLSHHFFSERMFSHPGCFLTRAVYEKYGLFNTKYIVAADWDLMLRLSKNEDVEFVPIKEVLANFTMGSINTTKVAVADTARLLRDWGLISGTNYRWILVREWIKKFSILHRMASNWRR